VTTTMKKRVAGSIGLSAAGVLAGAGLLLLCGCRGGGGAHRADVEVSVSLADLLEEQGEAAPATLQGAEPAADEQDLASYLAEQAAALDRAFAEPASESASAAPPLPPPSAEAAEPDSTDEGADVSLAQLMGDESPAEETAGTSEPDGAGAAGEASPDAATEDPTARVDDLYAQLQQALGQEIHSTSEPFRTAVALVSLAAARGEDPLGAIGPGTPAGSRLSPAERASVETIAQLLGTLLSPGEGEGDRAQVLQQLAARMTKDIGLRIPTAVLCTRVRGFGKYEPFSKTDFLAGRPIRALVYAEVEGFEHREMDASKFGDIEIEDRWSVELSEELKLYHVADGRLAWRRPAEKVVETSRNRQRDFYLLADIELPRTLTVGSYQLKVIIKDDVSGAVAETIIPIGVVADPGLAWSAD